MTLEQAHPAPTDGALVDSDLERSMADNLQQSQGILRPLHDFVRTEAASGLLLLAMIPVALLWANGPFADSYESLWTTDMGLSIGSFHFSLDVRHWVNDGVMALFFFVVGLEIKRELVEGELRDRRKALTPVLAAIGGMAIPALLYTAFNFGGPGGTGWAIPMATDIAIVLGFLSLMGSRVPQSLKTFLLTLAIVDDVGAIIVIAIFYPEHALNYVAFVPMIALFGFTYMLRRYGVRQPVIFTFLALAAWGATHAAGVHATLAGVILALLTPTKPVHNPAYVDAEELSDVSSVEAASSTASLARRFSVLGGMAAAFVPPLE